MIVITIKGDTADEIAEILNKTISKDFIPTLAFVFMSVKRDSGKVCKLLDERGILIFGATTAGEFIDGEIGQESITIMLLDMNPAHFRVVFYETEKDTKNAISKKLANDGKEMFDKPGFIVVSGGINSIGENIISGLEEILGKDIAIYGGMAGDDLNLNETFVFTNNKISNNALVAVIVDTEKINLQGHSTCGWEPIGKSRTVTGSSKNIIYTIDNLPALDQVIEFLGVDINLYSSKEIVIDIGAYFPFYIVKDEVFHIMRTAMFVNKEDRSLICAGLVPEGSEIYFSLPPDRQVIDNLNKEFYQLKKEKQPEAEALIMFSCISRFISLNNLVNAEIENVKEIWNCPLIGFFSYGEFGKSLNSGNSAKSVRNEFHNNTCSIVVIKEK
jgi:hypothetical protein